MEKIHELNKWRFRDLNDMYSLNHGYSLIHVKAIDIILGELNIKFGQYIHIEPSIVTNKISENFIEFSINEYNYIVEKLNEEGLIKIKNDNKNEFKITTKGKELISFYGTFEEHLKSEFDFKLKEAQMVSEKNWKQIEHDKLQIESLKRGISKMKYWWVFILLNILITIITSIGIDYFKQQSGIFNTNQTSEHHEQK